MSLIDLKKSNSTKSSKKQFTVDEFIEDAEAYAQGEPKIVAGESLNVEKALILTRKIKKTEPELTPLRPKRHATFTLSEEAIEQLASLAQDTALAKSHIIRILINEVANELPEKKLMRLLKSNTP